MRVQVPPLLRVALVLDVEETPDQADEIDLLSRDLLEARLGPRQLQEPRELIIQALDKTGGNVTRASQLLMISRKSLQNKMKEFNLRDEE